MEGFLARRKADPRFAAVEAAPKPKRSDKVVTKRVVL